MWLDVDAGLVAVGIGPNAQRHRDLLERRDARPLADAVDRALDLAGAGGDTGQRVRDGEPEVVVAVDGDESTSSSSGQSERTSRTNPAYSSGSE